MLYMKKMNPVSTPFCMVAFTIDDPPFDVGAMLAAMGPA